MPKPNTLPLWATQNLYTNGPDAGTPTKATPPQAKQDEGWLPTEPPPAQWQNSWQHLVYAWTKWVDEGKSSFDKDAHLVETDNDGHAKVRQLSASTDSAYAIVGESNTGHGVMGKGKSVGVLGVGTDVSTGVTGISGPQGGFGVYGLGNQDAPGVYGVGQQEGTGVVGRSGDQGYGVQAIGRAVNPVRASFYLRPQFQDPSSLQNGDLWLPNTHDRLRARMDGQNHTLWSTPAGMVNEIAMQGPLSAKAPTMEYVNVVTLQVAPVGPEVGELRVMMCGQLGITASLYQPDSQLPDYTRSTQIRVWNATDNETVMPVKLTPIRCDNTSIRNLSFCHMATYTPPSPGPKTFHLQFNWFNAIPAPNTHLNMNDAVLHVTGMF